MLSKISIFIIQFYQLGVSPFKRPCCRYVPSCSEYAKKHIEKYGILRSFFPSLKRVCSCNPFSKKEFWDPVK